MSNRKKPTNKELVEMLYTTNLRIDEVYKTIGTVGQTMSDYIDFKKNHDDFLTYLKEKYPPEKTADGKTQEEQ